MTWESQGPATPQDPRWSGASSHRRGRHRTGLPAARRLPADPAGYPPPPPGYPPAGGYPPPPPGYQPPPPGYPPAGGYPPPPPGYQPPGYLPPEPTWQPPPAYPLAPDAYPVNVSYDRLARINRLWGIPVVGHPRPHHPAHPALHPVGAHRHRGRAAQPRDLDPGAPPGALPGLGLPLDRRPDGLVHPRAGLPRAADTDLSALLALRRGAPGERALRRGRAHQPALGHPAHRHLGALPSSSSRTTSCSRSWPSWPCSCIWFTWVPVLFLGRQADVIYTIVGGYNRWYFRVLAYQLLMVDRYPPFSLGEDDPRL